MRRVLYFAAPLRPTEDDLDNARKGRLSGYGPQFGMSPSAWDRAVRLEATNINLRRAKDGMAALRRAFPETTFIAPWIASVLSGEDDSDPAQREAGLLDDCAVVERCDGIVLWGARVSDGMRRESDHGLTHGLVPNGDGADQTFEVYDLVGIDPAVLGDARGRGFMEWYVEFKEQR